MPSKTDVVDENCFFVRKRQLQRKADQIKKFSNCDTFIIIHNKTSGKIYPYQTDPTLNLELVSSLVMRDLEKELKTYKIKLSNESFKNLDYNLINNNIKSIKEIQDQMKTNTDGSKDDNDVLVESNKGSENDWKKLITGRPRKISKEVKETYGEKLGEKS